MHASAKSELSQCLGLYITSNKFGVGNILTFVFLKEVSYAHTKAEFIWFK